MDPEVIWRVREREQLERCFQLSIAEYPEAEREGPGAESIAMTFAWEISRLLDDRDFSLPRPERFEWPHGKIRIRYRVVPMAQAVEVLEVIFSGDP